MSIFLSKERTGLARHILVCDDKISLIDDTPQDGTFWHIDEKSHLSIERVANARSICLKILPDDARITWWNQWTQNPRIDHILPKSVVLSHVKKLIAACQSTIDDQYFAGQFQIQNQLLDAMHQAHVDLKSLNQQTDNIVDAFASNSDGLCSKIVYDNFSSSTGRMSVKSGPKILTMNKDLRYIFRSSLVEEGELISIDFSALEPRVIMTLMGQRSLPSDIYSAIGESLDLTHIDRKTIKLMILSILYGMARKNFIVKFMSERDPDLAYDKIRDLLGVRGILDRIKQEMSGSVIKNHYGRPLKCENESLYVNHFTQSTAVDVACEGFLNLIKDNQDIMRPVFILHDELVVDINKADVDKLRDRISAGIYIPSLATSFHVTTKVFNARKSDQ